MLAADLKAALANAKAYQTRLALASKRYEVLKSKGHLGLMPKDILTSEFLRENTRFVNIKQFYAAIGGGIVSDKGLEKLSQDSLNASVAKITKYSSWDEMSKAAIQHYAKPLDEFFDVSFS